MLKTVCACVFVSLLPLHSIASPNLADARTTSHSDFISQLASVPLVDQFNQPFQATAIRGQTLLVNFIFTECDAICPSQTKQLVEIMRALPATTRAHLTFVSITIDPHTDTPAKLKQFAHTWHAEFDNWLFLTGKLEDINQLTDNFLIFSTTDALAKNRPQIHSASLWLVDGKGRMLQRYRGDPPDKQRLINELQQLTQLLATNATPAHDITQ